MEILLYVGQDCSKYWTKNFFPNMTFSLEHGEGKCIQKVLRGSINYNLFFCNFSIIFKTNLKKVFKLQSISIQAICRQRRMMLVSMH